jgi:hypothetical protein
MSPKLAGFLLLGASCVAAAGAGAYLATRQNGADVAQVAEASAQPGTLPAAGVVSESEGEIATTANAPVTTGPNTSTSAGRPAPVARPSSDPRRTPPPRTQAPPVRPQPQPERPVEPGEVPQAAKTESSAVPPPATESAGIPPAREPEPAPSPEVPAVPERRFDELVVPSDSVIGLQVETALTSNTARIEDRVTARVTRDVRVAGTVAIPAGSRVQGAVVAVERGGKFKERARLGVRFHTLVLADGSTIPLQTETVFREGDAPTGQTAAKIGGAAIGGAILGAILGGGKGALVGGATGAGAGTAAVAAGDRSEATLSSGSRVTVRLSSPVAVTVERRE